MAHAYQEIYLNKAQKVLGEAFDYAINTQGITGENFIKVFLVSSVSKNFEKGNLTYIKGKSGIELFLDIAYEIL